MSTPTIYSEESTMKWLGSATKKFRPISGPMPWKQNLQTRKLDNFSTKWLHSLKNFSLNQWTELNLCLIRMAYKSKIPLTRMLWLWHNQAKLHKEATSGYRGVFWVRAALIIHSRTCGLSLRRSLTTGQRLRELKMLNQSSWLRRSTVISDQSSFWIRKTHTFTANWLLRPKTPMAMMTRFILSGKSKKLKLLD